MKTQRVIAVSFVFSCVLQLQVALADDTTRMAVEKGLFFLERQAMTWWKDHECASCHEGPMLLMAHNVAKLQGVPVDQTKLDFWSDRWVLLDARTHVRKDGRKDAGGMAGLPFILLYRDRSHDASPQRAVIFDELVQIAGEWQDPDGHWGVGPQQHFDITPWMALALASLEQSAIPFDAAARARITSLRSRTEAAIRIIKPAAPEKTEHLAGWLVYEYTRGEHGHAQELLDELLKRQHDDGGWGLRDGDPTHLLVTGAALFALKSAGLANEHPGVARARRLLLDRQADDGRWREKGRIFKPDGYDDTYDAWTTAWATAGLALTLPRMEPGAAPLFVPSADAVADVTKLTAEAAEGYIGSAYNDGDPTDEVQSPVSPEQNGSLVPTP